MPTFFELQAKDSETSARVGLMHTAHGVIETPIFMPVGTRASVKSVPQAALSQDVRAQIILGNTYHLYLRPGLEVLKSAGGLHKFMSWDKPILTDSGGYQVYSLAQRRKLTPEGVIFASHIDGSKHIFTPKNVVDKQRSIGSDILMVLDECTPYPCEYAYAARSLELTHRWAIEARRYFLETTQIYDYPQFQFGIVQGSVYTDLRKQSCQAIIDQDFDGNAIGGLAVGEPPEEMYDITSLVCELLPEHKPRYLMGVGTPANILEAISRGVDMMDCVMPTRNARHGLLFTWSGKLNIKNEKFKFDHSPIDETSNCPYDLNYSKAYLRHLIINEEYLGLTIASIHNLYFYLELVKQARQKILSGTFKSWLKEVLPKLEQRL